MKLPSKPGEYLWWQYLGCECCIDSYGIVEIYNKTGMNSSGHYEKDGLIYSFHGGVKPYDQRTITDPTEFIVDKVYSVYDMIEKLENKGE